MEMPKMTNPRYRLEVAFKTPHLPEATDKTHQNEEHKKKWVWFPKNKKQTVCGPPSPEKQSYLRNSNTEQSIQWMR